VLTLFVVPILYRVLTPSVPPLPYEEAAHWENSSGGNGKEERAEEARRDFSSDDRGQSTDRKEE